MIGRKAIIGLSLLSALLFCAFAVQSASAVEKKASATAYTCVAKSGGDFKDAHCDENSPGTGSFAHVEITKNTKTLVAATNEKVTENTTKSEPAVLKSEVPGGKVTITCTTVKNNETESFIENTEPEPGVMRVSGTAKTEFTNCTITELAKCVVAEPIVSMATFEAVEGLTGPKAEANAMGMKFKGEGTEETFAEIEFKNKGTEKCSLNEKKFKVKGSVIATSGPTTESKQDNKWSGATQVFTPKFSMESLKLGENAAEFSTILTPSMASAGNPIAGTTG
jgi:hypothetical protein